MKLFIKVWLILLILYACHLEAQTIRIACVGNSITYGAGIEDRDNDNYANQLQKILGDEYDVRAFGVSGRKLMHNCYPSIWDESVFWASLDFNPDIVIILLGTNDVKLDCWNLHKDEFIPEYSAMIDTFRVLPSEPVIYGSYPPPVFGTSWGPRDSVITADLLYKMDSIAVEKNIELIDFNTPFQGHNELFPDDIHPSAHGSWLMAKIIYEKLTGNSIVVAQDVNVVRKAKITVNSEENSAHNLIDGNQYTFWTFSGGSNTVVLSLQETKSVDMFQIFFSKYLGSHPRVTVETSIDSISWNQIIDQAEQDTITTNMIIRAVTPVETKYIKFTVWEATSDIAISEFRALSTAPIHAPIMKYDLVSKTGSYTRINFITLATHSGNFIRNMFRSDTLNLFNNSKHFRKTDSDTTQYIISTSQSYQFISSAYANNYEVWSSDTLALDYHLTDIQSQSTSVPDVFKLFQNHPNPFNSNTIIKYRIEKQSNVKLEIFNAIGQKIETLVDEKQMPNEYSIKWELTENNTLPSGTYFCRLKVDNQIMSNRMLYIK